MTNWTVGQQCVVVTGPHIHFTAVTKVGRKYVHVAGKNGHVVFAPDGRCHGPTYGHEPQLFTIEGYGFHEKRAAVERALSKMLSHWHSAKLTITELDDLATLVARVMSR